MAGGNCRPGAEAPTAACRQWQLTRELPRRPTQRGQDHRGQADTNPTIQPATSWPTSTAPSTTAMPMIPQRDQTHEAALQLVRRRCIARIRFGVRPYPRTSGRWTGMNRCPQVAQVRGGSGSRRRAAFRRSPHDARRHWRFASFWQARHRELRPSLARRSGGNSASGFAFPLFEHRFSAIGGQRAP
jgi:hypothetical protein